MPSPDPPSATCPACGYTLGEGPIAHCPECGAATTSFPDIARHKHQSRITLIEKCLYVCAAAPLMFYAALVGLLCIARFSLGRWPNRYGMDDPKYIPLVRELMIPTSLLMIWILVAIPVALVLWGWLMVRPVHAGKAAAALDAPSVIVVLTRSPAHRASVIAGAIWIVGIVLVRTDPTKAIRWFMD